FQHHFLLFLMKKTKPVCFTLLMELLKFIIFLANLLELLQLSIFMITMVKRVIYLIIWKDQAEQPLEVGYYMGLIVILFYRMEEGILMGQLKQVWDLVLLHSYLTVVDTPEDC